MAELRRAQLLYGWIPVPRAYRDPQTSLRSAGLVKALRASFAALRPCRVTRPPATAQKAITAVLHGSGRPAFSR